MEQKANPHVLLVAFPIQGHVAPFIKLGHQLAIHGCKVTFLTTDFIRARMEMVEALQLAGGEQKRIRIVSVPDGLATDDERKDEVRLAQSVFCVMAGHLEDFIKKVNKLENEEKVSCVIADSIFNWALEVAEKMGIKKAVLFVAGPGCLATILHIPRLIETGIIGAEGTPLKNEKIQLLPSLPDLTSADFSWNYPGNMLKQKGAFQYELLARQNMLVSDWVFCNWFHELDPSVDCLLPNILSVGPLQAKEQLLETYWLEDSTCLTWLDRQLPRSVIYIAFGSTSKFSQNQLDEIAFGLQLIGKPFLWVIRSDMTDGVATEYPDGFKETAAKFGKIVPWAPQEKVLAHPAIACFLTHCGWNSTMEGMTMGVPLLCWPYFADQFYGRSCVCYGWKTGLDLCYDENGIITRNELKKKVDELICDEGIKANAMKLKELAQKAVGVQGSSSKTLENFVAQLML